MKVRDGLSFFVISGNYSFSFYSFIEGCVGDFDFGSIKMVVLGFRVIFKGKRCVRVVEDYEVWIAGLSNGDRWRVVFWDLC